MRAVHVRITGIVQGVGYRAWTERQARARGLDGWVRNRRDGSVEAVIVGDAAAVEDMLEAFRAGPPGGRVDDVLTENAAEPVTSGFEVRPTH